MKQLELEKDEDELEEHQFFTNGFDDWVDYRHSSPPPFSSSPPSSSSSSSQLFSPTHHRSHELSIFPPVNHEGLPISRSNPIPNSNSNPNSSSPSSPPSQPCNSQIVSWFDFALHLWNSKLNSVMTRLRFPGFWLSFRPVVGVASVLVGLWLWVRRRRKRVGGGQRVEQLEMMIKEKDEKIVRLLEQIAELNKTLLTRYRVPVLKSS